MYVMMTYLTNVWSLSTTHAAAIINVWNGISLVLPVAFAFFVDAFVGNYAMLLLSSVAYTVGLGLLSMSTPPVTGPCNEYKKECVGHQQKALFYAALALTAVGMSGHVVSLKSFLEQQIDDQNENENIKEEEPENIKEEEPNGGSKIFWQIPGALAVVVVPIVGGIVLPYIKLWSIRFGVPAICTLVATLLFLSGSLGSGYTYVRPNGSPLTTTLRVLVAAASNTCREIPKPEQLYNDDDTRATRSLRCLDKAAMVPPPTSAREERISKRWKLCTIREVEDAKTGIRMVPMWATFVAIGLVLSIGNTYFLEQANHMDRKLGRVTVPIPIFLVFYNSSSSASAYLYTLLAGCLPNKYAPPVGIATSMVFSVLCCVTAAKLETRRLHTIRDHGLLEKPDERIPMSIFWLLPQFVLLAVVDGLANTSITGFFKNQVPESMRAYLTYFTKGVFGLGTVASVLSVYVVGKISERNHKPNWFRFTLNKSRLDRYYWTLAGVSAVNLVMYVVVACFYRYKESASDDGGDEGEGGEMREDFQEDGAKCLCF